MELQPKMPGQGQDNEQRLAHHEAAIVNLANRQSSLETSVHGLTKEVHAGFSQLSQTLGNLSSKFEARPALNIHQISQTIFVWACLFSMVVGGIIYVCTAQFSPAFQKINDDLGTLQLRSSWQTTTTKGGN